MKHPSFYEREKVGEIWIERAGLIADAADEWRTRHAVTPSTDDRFRVAAFGIDCQVGFCTPGASLFVPGAVEDTQRTAEWLYANLGAITTLVFSMDTHRVFQIFHPSWWTDPSGRHPAPFTVISHDDVRDGRWTPRAQRDLALEYTKKLAASGRYVLTIWPYHTLLGGISHALVPALMEAAIFHATVRGEPTRFESKGTHELTESYSVMAPEVRELGGKGVGAFNAPLFDALMAHDRVYVFGQAKSHCVLSTLLDLRRHIEASDRSQLGKIWILEDAMSPVSPPPVHPLPPELDFPKVAARAIDELRAAGMHVCKTSDLVTP